MLIVLIKSIIIGALAGFGVGAGAARMFHAPGKQGMGAFRTLGELNACQGDAISHASFGLGFFFNAWASAIGAGAFTQDVDHRIIPNWAAAILMAKGGKPEDTLHNPKKMAIVSSIVGIVVVSFLNLTAAAIPEAMRMTAVSVLVPAANALIDPIMPIIFWLAALEAGKRCGVWGTVLGGFATVIMGNGVPGVVLGILLGKGLDESGWNKVTKLLLSVVIILFLLSGFFREVDIKLITQMGMQAPEWLNNLHGALNIGG